MNFALPGRFDDDGVFNVIPQFQKLEDVPDLVFDFKGISYVFPFPTLALFIAILELIEKRKAKGLRTSATGTELGYSAISYLRHLGFFRGLGLPVGNAPNQAQGGTYLPLTIITRQDLEDASAGQPFQEAIDHNSDRLAQVIFSGNENAGPAIMLSYCLREIIRNSFEHAGVSQCFVMAQRWPDGEAEITIADRGMGFYSSLSQQHVVSSAEHALILALQPGITSGADRCTGDKWDNSGFGLYITSELGRMYGDFSVLSSSKLLRHNNRQVFEDVPLAGTIVRLKVNTRDSEYFSNILVKIVLEGEEAARKITGSVKAASKMSRTHALPKI
jgi:hypothetical protein